MLVYKVRMLGRRSEIINTLKIVKMIQKDYGDHVSMFHLGRRGLERVLLINLKSPSLNISSWVSIM